MVKVGILSMQRIANYGSFLQAYGLKQILEELGCDVQFVDYHPGETLVPSCEGTGIKRKISKVFEVIDYKAPLKEKLRFIKYKKNYAANYYPYLGITKEYNYTPELDLLIIGSDEVFNCVQDNTNVGFAPELFGKNNKAKRVISYAASFGNTTLEKLKQYKVDTQVSEWLMAFDAISVRDKNSGFIIENLTGKKPEYNLDPVLAYDFIGKCKQIPKTVPEEKYMILYGYSGRFSKEECESIREYAKANNLKVFCIGGIQTVCDKFIDCNPFEVIAYFMHAECVVTDTFHGTILSIITHQKFATLVRNSGYGNSEKLKYLLEKLCLNKQILNNLEDLKRLLNTIVDYSITDNIIFEERKRTFCYLERYVKINAS